MSRTLVIGDIHGGLRGLRQLLEHPALEGDERFVFLGDYVDGWSESAQVLNYLLNFRLEHDCIFIIGNHDRWCENWLRGEEPDPKWLIHGGTATIQSYQGFSNAERLVHADFLASLHYYHIDAQNRLFIHAGFTSMHGVEKEVFPSNYFWDRTLWEAALLLHGLEIDPTDPYYPKRFSHYSAIFIGHTATTNYGSELPIQADKLWNLDTGACYKGKLSMMDIDSKAVWQSDPLHLLYPDEQGRN